MLLQVSCYLLLERRRQVLERLRLPPPACGAYRQGGNRRRHPLRQTQQLFFLLVIANEFQILLLLFRRSIPPVGGQFLITGLQKRRHPVIRRLDRYTVEIQNNFDIRPAFRLQSRLVFGDEVQPHQAGIKPPVPPRLERVLYDHHLHSDINKDPQ